MSRYHVDKVLREVVLDTDKRARYLENTASYVADRDLTEEERRALVDHDYATLYALGAHPFLLFGWHATLSRRPEMVGLVREYAAAIRQFGYPDWAT